MGTIENRDSTLSEFDRPVLPSGLNVLTILTIIGSAFSFLTNIWNFIQAKQAYVQRDKVLEQMSNPKAPAFIKRMMGDPQQFMEMVTKSYENRIPILIIGLVAVGLCFAGALQMRKLHKQGFLFYIIGELLPFLASIFFIGTFIMTNIFVVVFFVISILFIIMYAVYRKHLVY